MDITIYDKATGQPKYQVTCPLDEASDQLSDPNNGWVTGHCSSRTHYVVEGVVQLRPEMPAVVSNTSLVADGVDSVDITGLPDPCVLTINGREQEVTGSTVTIRARYPAAYSVSCKHWPYLDWAVTIEAV